MIYIIFLFTVLQVNGIFRLSLLGFNLESLWPLCSFSPRTTENEDALKDIAEEERVSRIVERYSPPELSASIFISEYLRDFFFLFFFFSPVSAF